MTFESQSAATEGESNVNRCRQLATQLMAERINFQEYAYNVTLAVIDAPERYMQDCLALVPPRVAVQYMDFLRNFLEPVDFMPCPRPFLVDTGSDQMIEQKKLQLRPKYIRLHALMKEKVA